MAKGLHDGQMVNSDTYYGHRSVWIHAMAYDYLNGEALITLSTGAFDRNNKCKDADSVTITPEQAEQLAHDLIAAAAAVRHHNKGE